MLLQHASNIQVWIKIAIKLSDVNQALYIQVYFFIFHAVNSNLVFSFDSIDSVNRIRER